MTTIVTLKVTEAEAALIAASLYKMAWPEYATSLKATSPKQAAGLWSFVLAQLRGAGYSMSEDTLAELSASVETWDDTAAVNAPSVAEFAPFRAQPEPDETPAPEPPTAAEMDEQFSIAAILDYDAETKTASGPSYSRHVEGN